MGKMLQAMVSTRVPGSYRPRKLMVLRAIPLAMVATESPTWLAAELEHTLLSDCLEPRVSLASECLTTGNGHSEEGASHLSYKSRFCLPRPGAISL